MPTPQNSLFITVIPLGQDFMKGNALDRLECYLKMALEEDSLS